MWFSRSERLSSRPLAEKATSNLLSRGCNREDPPDSSMASAVNTITWSIRRVGALRGQYILIGDCASCTSMHLCDALVGVEREALIKLGYWKPHTHTLPVFSSLISPFYQKPLQVESDVLRGTFSESFILNFVRSICKENIENEILRMASLRWVTVDDVEEGKKKCWRSSNRKTNSPAVGNSLKKQWSVCCVATHSSGYVEK